MELKEEVEEVEGIRKTNAINGVLKGMRAS